MKTPLVECVSNAIIREAKKWDGITDYGNMVATVCMFSRPLAKRLIRIIKGR